MLHRLHRFNQRVYYEDTDFSGLVYHAAYLKFLERGRTEWLRMQGLSQKALFAQGIAFVVHHLEITFHASAQMDDEMVITTRIHQQTPATMQFAQTIHAHERLLISAQVIVAAINADHKPLRISKVLAKLQ